MLENHEARQEAQLLQGRFPLALVHQAGLAHKQNPQAREVCREPRAELEDGLLLVWGAALGHDADGDRGLDVGIVVGVVDPLAQVDDIRDLGVRLA